MWQEPAPRASRDPTTRQMKYDNKTVLDTAGRPILDYSTLPLAISSGVEGWRMEAWMRADPRIKHTDIVARLRTQVVNHRRQPMKSSRALSSRSATFRTNYGVISWSARTDNTGKRTYLDSLRSAHQRANNLGIQRDLTAAERSRVRRIVKGTREYGDAPPGRRAAATSVSLRSPSGSFQEK